jgi:hypothetical protein
MQKTFAILLLAFAATVAFAQTNKSAFDDPLLPAAV